MTCGLGGWRKRRDRQHYSRALAQPRKAGRKYFFVTRQMNMRTERDAHDALSSTDRCVRCQVGQGRSCPCRDALMAERKRDRPEALVVKAVAAGLLVWALVEAVGVLR